MAVTKIIELSAASARDTGDAVRRGLEKAAKTVKNIRGTWINDTKVATDGRGA